MADDQQTEAMPSPTVRRRRLAAELRRRRRDLGLTREVVAAHVGCSPVTITRIESAAVGARVSDVAMMLDLYNVTGPDRDALLTLAREAKRRGWWQQYSGSSRRDFLDFVGLEDEASSIKTYEGELIPGLLQTEKYARALFGASGKISTEEVARWARLRAARQGRLFGEHPMTYSAVVREGALRQQTGGRSVMRDQLNHMLEVMRRPNVTVQVLPFVADTYPTPMAPFVILTFPELGDPAVVYVDYFIGCLYLEKEDEIEAYTSMFSQLQERALDPEDSSSLIADIAKDMT